MAGTLALRELSARARPRLRFAVATPADDAAIRGLLRASPTGGAVSLSFEREPDYFRGANLAGNEDETLLAWDGDALACVGRCSIRPRFLDGEIRRVAYLAELRLAPEARGNFEAVQRGYQFLRERHEAQPADFYFTSIAADNHRARRLLERGLPGMPRYHFLSEFVTRLVYTPAPSLALRRANRAVKTLQASGLQVAVARKGHIAELVKFLNHHGRRHQLAAAWTEPQLESLEKHGLPIGNFRLLLKEGEIVGCGALWDQRGFRQNVIRGYSPTPNRLRPICDFVSPVFGWPRLPKVGAVLAHGFLSPLIVAPEVEIFLPPFAETFFPLAAELGLNYLTLGLPAAHPALPALRRSRRGREYLSRFYQVDWRDAPAQDWHGLPMPEVALL